MLKLIDSYLLQSFLSDKAIVVEQFMGVDRTVYPGVTYCDGSPGLECFCGAREGRFYCYGIRIESLTPQSFNIFMSPRKGIV